MSRSDNIVQFPERAAIEEEAARWIVRMDEGLSETDRTQFEAWRAASPAHAETFARLKTHWNDLDGIAKLVDAPAPTPVWRRPVAWIGAGAAAAAAALVAAVLVNSPVPRTQPAAGVQAVEASPQVGVYTTALGSQDHIKLSDGSVVVLNTASRIEARMTDSERSVRLLSGEAFFEVAHDPSRPFRVYAGDGVTTAVGTAFSVRLEKNDIKVVVSKGKVSFSNVSDRVEPVAYISAGQTGTFNDKIDVVETIKPEEINRKLSWTEGRLIFAGEPLSTVVSEISRYTDIEFTYATPELASKPIGGYFEVGEVDRMLEALETSIGLRVERVDARHVRILGARE